ncbi:LAME_0H17568g1_1 [Lachancea meyersii CBS 8951]|uniref:LAME_0H17568g1_1 n=1 Tax=Lachancea meyersii CBS 8951 TaxID=1266667 RepID=A0A1G4KIT6_9SACH|nr:LAME_0H17568g1_1 [Lachancea meyersii CBS 8951]
MIFQSILVAVALFLQVSAAGTSFLAVNSQRYKDALQQDGVESWAELSTLSYAEEPLICFRFTKFDLLAQIVQSPAEIRFLPTFFEELVNQVWNHDSFVDEADSSPIQIGKLPKSPLASFYNQIDRENDVVVFEFTDSEYDLTSLDEYLETAYLFLEESLANIDNIVIQVPSVSEGYTRSTAKTSEVDVSDPEKQPEPSTPAGDSNEMSTLWTEGLISCLIVAGILLAILIVAISWITSLDISYGAFEKPANPIKKTN